MCVIVICAKRPVTNRELELCWAGNPAGAGVAWAEGGQTHYRKGLMTLAEMKAFYHSRIFPLGHIVHFRIPSAGGGGPELTHPFIVSAASPITMTYSGKAALLTHNGTVKDWAAILSTTAVATETRVVGAISDSRLAAIVRHFVPAMLMEWASQSFNKFAILSHDGKVTMIGDFEKVDGNFFSNTLWQHPKKLKAVCSVTDFAKPRSGGFKEAKHSDSIYKVTPRFKSQFLHRDSDSWGVISGD